jgi:hypothetical protein
MTRGRNSSIRLSVPIKGRNSLCNCSQRSVSISTSTMLMFSMCSVINGRSPDAGRRFASRRFFQDQPAIDNFGIGIFRKFGIDRLGRLQQSRFQGLGKGSGIGFDASDLAILRQFAIQGVVVNQLFPVIVVTLAMLDEQVTRL